jgi:ribosomal protein S18 acetylase RimI-like enzyme
MDLVRTHDPREAERLLGAGHRLHRLAHDMAAELGTGWSTGAEAIPSGFLMVGINTRRPSEVAAAAATATPPDHVDFPVWATMDREAYWVALLSRGGPCGPVEPVASRLLLGPAAAIVGAVAVTVMPRSAWWRGGAWIPEIFVLPEFQNRGLGRLLLSHAMGAAAQAGHQRIGLTVSDGNLARRLYERHGFRVFRSTWFIDADAAATRPP